MDVLWADAEVASVSFDYDSLRLALTESTGHTVVVEAGGLVGVELVGLWDEIVVECGELIADHPFAQRCWRAFQQRPGEDVLESGSSRGSVLHDAARGTPLVRSGLSL